MGQILHRSATTTEAIRRAIQHSQESLRTLARSSRALRQVQERAQAVQPLGRKRGVGQGLRDLVADRKNPYLMIDSTIVRAHQQAATGRKKGARTRLWGAPEEV
jgi:hypothetical protein